MKDGKRPIPKQANIQLDPIRGGIHSPLKRRDRVLQNRTGRPSMGNHFQGCLPRSIEAVISTTKLTPDDVLR